MKKTITIHELKTLLDGGTALSLIDVRTPAEYESVHVPGAKLLPLDTLDCAAVLAGRDKAGARGPVYILCHSGVRAKKAAERFSAVGFGDCLVVEGGTQAWSDAGFPVERGSRRVLPLDRQMQMCIGAIVLGGVLLSVLVHPAWVWLSAFAGCGLLFAGLTGICPLRSVVARMPWNQSGGCQGGTCCGA